MVPDGRLLRVEEAVHDFRRRFWWALLGYVILAAAGVGTIAYLQHTHSQVENVQKIEVVTICAAAEVIRTQPHEIPSASELESPEEFRQRLEAAAVFLRGARALCTHKVFDELGIDGTVRGVDMKKVLR